MTLLLILLAVALAVPIITRCVCVSAHVSGDAFKTAHSIGKWHGFAISYIALGAAALFGVVDVYRTGGSHATWLFLIASAGLVMFDPRRPK